MATIDTSTIEGFDSMTAEQKVEAILKLDIPEDRDMSKFVDKALFDKTSSELAKVKKDLAAKRTDDENAAEAARVEREEMQNKYNELLKSSTIAQRTNNFIAMGYDANLAKETAEALFNGDMEKVFANQKVFNEAREKSLKAEWIKNDPKPGGAGSGGSGDKTEAEKIAEAMAKRHAENRKTSNDAIKNYF